MYQLTGIVLTIAFLAIFLFLISRMNFFRVGGIPVRWFQAVFVLKVVCGFLLYLIYTYHYTDRSTADIWKYFDDGMVMFSALRSHPTDYFQMLFGVFNDAPHFEQYYDRMNHWYRPYGSSIANDTHTIIRFNAFIRMFSLGYYNVHSVVINFLGLIGLTGIFWFVRQMAPEKEKWFFAGVFLMPGMMFWASGVLKEPLLLFGLGLFLFGTMKWVNEGFSIGKLLVVILSLFFLFTVKSYALVAILPGLMAWRLCVRFPKPHPSVIFGSIYLVLGIGVAMIGNLVPEKDPLQRLAQKQHEFYQLAAGGTYVRATSGDTLYIESKHYAGLAFSEDKKSVTPISNIEATAWNDVNSDVKQTLVLLANERLIVLLDYGKTGSTIEIPRLEANIRSILKAMPQAFVNASFRPFPWDINSPFMLLSGLESLLVIMLFILAIRFFQKEPLDHPILYVCIFFAFVILILTGLVTPVVGAIVRYKVPALPFLVCALFAVSDTQRIIQRLKRLPFLKAYF